MTTPLEVREHLRTAECFLRGGDPYGAFARAKLAARQAATMSSLDGVEARMEIALALDRFGAAQEEMRREAERRQALHVTNERRHMAGSDDLPIKPESPPRRSWIAALFGRIAPSRRRQARHRPLEA